MAKMSLISRADRVIEYLSRCIEDLDSEEKQQFYAIIRNRIDSLEDEALEEDADQDIEDEDDDAYAHDVMAELDDR